MRKNKFPSWGECKHLPTWSRVRWRRTLLKNEVALASVDGKIFVARMLYADASDTPCLICEKNYQGHVFVSNLWPTQHSPGLLQACWKCYTTGVTRPTPVLEPSYLILELLLELCTDCFRNCSKFFCTGASDHRCSNCKIRTTERLCLQVQFWL